VSEPRPSGSCVRASPAGRGSEAAPTPNLYDYGAIGNLHTAALVSRFGGIDWACLPRFASPSVFARLLDRRRGGFAELAPAEKYESEQTYLPSTNILLTRSFLSGGRQLDLLDFMPVEPGHGPEGLAMLVRVVEARGGSISLRTGIEPRFQYALEPAAWSGDGGDFVATGSRDRLRVRSDLPLVVEGSRLVGTADLQAGERRSVEIAWGAEWPTPVTPERMLQATTEFWQGWVHPPTTPIHRVAGLWHTWVERSELVLKLLSHEDTGAFVAAPTTSLPEWLGGSRNWDYRYVWVRDAAFCAQALLLFGHYVESERFLSWVVGRLSDADGSRPLRVLYDAHGEAETTERELPYLAGFGGSRPVRVGNAAGEQFQLDIYGELLDAARLLSVRRRNALRAEWPRLVGVTEAVVEHWSQPDRGMWEVRGPPQHYVHSKLMAWVALDRSVDLARRFGDSARAERWVAVRDEVRDWILREGYDPASRSFVQAAGQPVADAANLRIPLVGFLPFDDERVQGTVHRIQEELSVGPFVYRYRVPDGIPGPEGTFLPAAFWMVECLARMGQRRRAFAHWRRLLLVASPLGLYPEEYDPVRRQPLGNFPQAFTHIGVLRAAVALGATQLPAFLIPPSVEEGQPEPS
jgi:alpha,alpha-trehalase